jgi:hypothetical protein
MGTALRYMQPAIVPLINRAAVSGSPMAAMGG